MDKATDNVIAALACVNAAFNRWQTAAECLDKDMDRAAHRALKEALTALDLASHFVETARMQTYIEASEIGADLYYEHEAND